MARPSAGQRSGRSASDHSKPIGSSADNDIMNNGNPLDSALIESSGKCKDQAFVMRVVMNICLASTYSGYCLGYFNTINFDDTVQIL